MKCPVCAADAYVGFSSVECSNPACAHYVAPLITIGPNGVMTDIGGKKYLAKVDIKAASDNDSGFMDKFMARIKAIPCLDGRKYSEAVCKAYRQETNPRSFCGFCEQEQGSDGQCNHKDECIVNDPPDLWS